MAFQFTVRSDKDTHFTGALAQDATEAEDIEVPGALQGINGNVRSHLRAISIVSDQNLAWEVMLFTADTQDDTDADVDTMVGFWQFATAGAVRIAGAGLYRYYIDGLSVPYVDDDNTGELHVQLLNRSVTGKLAGATGEIAIEFTMEPMTPSGGWG